jgi:hypothetical protein
MDFPVHQVQGPVALLGRFPAGYSEEDKPKNGVESFKIERLPGDGRTIPTGGQP